MPSCLKQYKDIEKARKYVQRMKRRYYEKYNYGIGKRGFTAYELYAIMHNPFSNDVQLAKHIKRSVNSIQNKRWKINKKYIQPK